MSRIPPLYVCPDCEPGPYMYAGKIIPKMCSVCSEARHSAQTGFDRARTGSDRMTPGIEPRIRRLFTGIDPDLRRAWSRHGVW